MKTQSLLAALIAAAGVAGTAQAALIASESFEGTAVGVFNGTGADLTWSTTSGNILGTGLSSGTGVAAVDGGDRSLQLTTTDVLVVGFGFAAQTDTFYFSYLASVPDGAFFQTYLNADSEAAVIHDARDTSSTANRIAARVNNVTDDNFAPYTGNNVTVLIVARVSKSGTNGNNFDTLELAVDPAAGPESFDFTHTLNTGLTSLNSFGVRVAVLSGGVGGTIDEIRVGTEYSDVVVPEPGSLALLGLGGLLVAPRRRRA